MNYETNPSCLDRLQREALTCLSGFPNKVSALNDIIANYAPEVTKKTHESAARDPSGIPVTLESAVKESSSENFCVTSIASTSNLERRTARQRLPKRKHHRERHFDQRIIRRRPGPLAHILTFLSNSLAICTKATVIRPSRYIANHALAMLRDTLIKRGQLVHVQCGPSTVWSMPEGRASLEMQIDLEITVENCIGIMRPAAAQLIADTTKLKRWLQALAVTFAPPTTPLIYAIGKTEEIDGWAYELFFHLKYLQENRIRNVEKKGVTGLKVCDDVRNTNLWLRLIELRDNYVFLYEILYSNDQYLKFSRRSTEIIK